LRGAIGVIHLDVRSGISEKYYMIGDQVHICKWILEHVDSPFCKIRVYKRKGGYFLEHKSIASEQDVAAGEADYVGEEMTCHSLRIAFCPFCGKKLGNL
jgi:hypothetical protein